MKKIVLLTLWMLAQMISPAQTTYENMPNLVSGLTKYRSKLMEQTPKEINRLRAFEERWLAGWTKEEKKEFYWFEWIVAQRYIRYKLSLKRFYKIFKRQKAFYPKYPLTEADLAVLMENAEFINWRNMGLLAYDFPYITKVDSFFLEEFAFYDVKQGEKVAEVGAGLGEFSLLLAMAFPGLEITVNEKDISNYVDLKKLFLRHQDVVDVEKITVVHGKSKSTELLAGKYDKILVRNSLHHFKRKKEMMASIRASMKVGGKLYIMEQPKEMVTSNHDCPKKMSEQEILQLAQETGFVVRRTLVQKYLMVWELE